MSGWFSKNRQIREDKFAHRQKSPPQKRRWMPIHCRIANETGVKNISPHALQGPYVL